ncbi:substrate-binding periplasmic protein [Iodobacter fluviatilis]|uniref:Amino acid ABC transporter substrate-binding protein (PAAT family) n=1 Tax=Iodobacter fluviatilis TaxID=537 RepID=A0A377Q3K5_9NEIS|nr:transporter substrate-binding domain-containing protein [Iodobacter fluviatilis]TCU90132.1 amino acid ABC transporter substrate-binding protein (PAAT family) [Iodobacter fluviatilis]STQ89159.1 Bacterial extracellular solute-binding proteins, family 3 [Iodobacter fluviatilis]
MKTLSILTLLLTSYSALCPAERINAVTETTAYSYIKDGKVSGPATEIIELTLKNAGLTDYSINIYPWARSYDIALKKTNVLIYLIARTPNRETEFKWVGELFKSRCFLIGLKDKTKISINKLEDAKRYSIGVVRDDVRQQYLQEKGFTRLSISAQQSDAFRQLLNNQVDLIALFEGDITSLCKQHHFDCDQLDILFTLNELSSGIYMAYSKKTPDKLFRQTQTAFDKIKAEGQLKKIMEKNNFSGIK